VPLDKLIRQTQDAHLSKLVGEPRNDVLDEELDQLLAFVTQSRQATRA
jgi:hypothetical protein